MYGTPSLLPSFLSAHNSLYLLLVTDFRCAGKDYRSSFIIKEKKNSQGTKVGCPECRPKILTCWCVLCSMNSKQLWAENEKRILVVLFGFRGNLGDSAGDPQLGSECFHSSIKYSLHPPSTKLIIHCPPSRSKAYCSEY